ncbi:MAG TPA: iron-containing alcohol dehydrogenase [Anaerolineales bacterium]
MLFFRSPLIAFGDDAASYLEMIHGRRAVIVTDEVIQRLGFVENVRQRLNVAGIECAVFDQVEAEPSIDTVYACAAVMNEFEPDWVVGLGGGSCMDVAKAAWFVYERPDVDLEAVNPLQEFGLRAKARLITIPTTSGSGSEVSQAAIIKDPKTRRKLEVGTFEFIADITIIDPHFSAHMPRQLTADTGIDVLAHAVDVYNHTWRNDFCDGLCLQAVRTVFDYLPQAVERGAEDMEARQKMANAATIAGLAFGNTNISLAHAMSHAAGAIWPVPHGRLTGLLLPGTVEFAANGGEGRYLDLARLVGLCADDEAQAGAIFAAAIRDLLRRVGQPTSLKEAGISRVAFSADLEAVCDRAEMDLGYSFARRLPDPQDLARLFEYAYQGKPVDF